MSWLAFTMRLTRSDSTCTAWLGWRFAWRAVRSQLTRRGRRAPAEQEGMPQDSRRGRVPALPGTRTATGRRRWPCWSQSGGNEGTDGWAGDQRITLRSHWNRQPGRQRKERWRMESQWNGQREDGSDGAGAGW